MLVAGAPEYDAGKVKGRTAVGTKLIAAVTKSGATVLCDAPGEAGLTSRANAVLKARGKAIEPEALALITDRAKVTAAERGGGGRTGDIHVLMNELEKAIAYAGDRALGHAGRRRLPWACTRSRTTCSPCWTPWAAATRAGRLAEADKMLDVGEKPDAVTARTVVMLARHLRQLWAAKYLDERRLNGFNVKAGLPPDVQSVLSGEMVGITQRQSFRLKDLQT